MSTARMRQLIAAADIDSTDSVTRELLKEGVLHFIKIRELSGSFGVSLASVTPKTPREYYTRLRRQIESYLHTAGIEAEKKADMDIQIMEPVDTDKTESLIGSLDREIEGVREKQREIQQEILKLEDLSRQMELSDAEAAGISPGESAFLVTRAGTVPEDKRQSFRKSLETIPSVLVPMGETQRGFLLVHLKRDKEKAESILKRHEWNEREISGYTDKAAGMARKDLKNRIGKLKEEQRNKKTETDSAVRKRSKELLHHWANLRMNELCASIQNYYGKTSRTMLFSGWVPAEKEKDVEEGIRRAAGGKCYLEWHDPGEAEGAASAEAPVKFNNPRFLAPFQMLVKNYAVPAYGTFDPTPVVAAAYLIMFGLMFGDAGHGLILILAGIIGTVLTKGKPFRGLFQLIIWCGVSACVMGVLFGSYFGMALFPPLWFDYHAAVMGGGTHSAGVITDIYGILMITVYFGISVIGIGLIINWYNRIRQRNWFSLILDKTGILGGWMYGAGIYTAFYFARRDFKSLPATITLALILGVPAVLFFLKPVVGFILERKHGKGKPFGVFTVIDFIMEWIVEMLEIFSGYLANTLSFLRVAGLGIAHVTLMAAFFEISGITGGASLNAGSLLILILGNALVIALEGLSAGIQSLRLNYYEFFSKYFSGNGIAYTPISLNQSDNTFKSRGAA